MRRRHLLRAGGSAVLAALAGCSTGASSEQTESEFDDPSPPWSRHDAVYHQSHQSGMKMLGTKQVGDRTVGLSYTYAERFWTVTGTNTQRVGIGPRPDAEYNAIHLMASVWHTETGTVLPVDAGLRVTVERGDEAVSDRAMWPMLSQQMGVHFGDNVDFPEQDEYSLVVDVGDATVRRLGALDDLSEEAGTVTFDFEFSRGIRNEIPVSDILDERGDRGALSPMEMQMQPLSFAPSEDDLPGRVLGRATSGDAVFVLTAAESGDGTYLTVSPRTPYNQYVLPLMSLSATVERDGTTVFDGPLTTAIGPERDYHYGTTVERIESGDKLTISVDAPPQVARHAGYETAFLAMPDISVTA